jgi:hypothetical protein
MLPRGWQDKARESGAMRRCREFPNAATLLRVLLIHLAEGCSLRETAVRAAAGGLVEVSDVAALKRLRRSGEWFRWIDERLMAQWITLRPVQPLLRKRLRIRLVDGSTVSEPGATGSTYQLHYSTHLPSLACDEVHVTDTSIGESLCRFAVAEGDVLIADRGFANRNGVRHVHRCGGAVIVRLITNLPLTDAKSQPFLLLRGLRGLRAGKLGDWPVLVRQARDDAAPAVAGRVCAIKKSKTAAQRSRDKAIREARKQNREIPPETLEAAAYIFVFTTLDDDILASAIQSASRKRALHGCGNATREA